MNDGFDGGGSDLGHVEVLVKFLIVDLDLHELLLALLDLRKLLQQLLLLGLPNQGHGFVRMWCRRGLYLGYPLIFDDLFLIFLMTRI